MTVYAQGTDVSGISVEQDVQNGNYMLALASYGQEADMRASQFDAALGAWTNQARAAGVSESNIISYLGAANAWTEATILLRGTLIPREIMRVQHGGPAPSSGWERYRPTSPPSLPSISSLLGAQGGIKVTTDPLTGTASHQVPIVPPPQITVPTVVAESSPAIIASIVQGGVSSNIIANLPAPTVSSGVGGPIGANPTQSALNAPNSVPSASAGVSGAAQSLAADTGSGFNLSSLPWWLWAIVAVGAVAFLAKDS